jgi:hypothetical protein
MSDTKRLHIQAWESTEQQCRHVLVKQTLAELGLWGSPQGLAVGAECRHLLLQAVPLCNDGLHQLLIVLLQLLLLCLRLLQ